MDAIRDANAVVIATEWEEIVNLDWAEVARVMCPQPLLFDGRNVLDPATITRLGFDYRGVGRSAGRGFTSTFQQSQSREQK
jgi:UDPglucose 6-dehydrogenase